MSSMKCSSYSGVGRCSFCCEDFRQTEFLAQWTSICWCLTSQILSTNRISGTLSQHLLTPDFTDPFDKQNFWHIEPAFVDAWLHRSFRQTEFLAHWAIICWCLTSQILSTNRISGTLSQHLLTPDFTDPFDKQNFRRSEPAFVDAWLYRFFWQTEFLVQWTSICWRLTSQILSTNRISGAVNQHLLTPDFTDSFDKQNFWHSEPAFVDAWLYRFFRQTEFLAQWASICWHLTLQIPVN